ncbi:MAG: hypothetical protein K8T10_04475 [Candidatus Eremiobacteraeota bacterium]|nr:hypothetical protein [Candidatus Eremiobacteraeota bacterium]
MVDAFHAEKDVTIRLISVYANYSETHIGISIDPPYDNWEITDVTIVDDLGRSYWISIGRNEKEDPYFPIKIKTDSLPDDVNKLLISIRRIYLPDREVEKSFEDSLQGKEEDILQNLSHLGEQERVSIEIKEINKKLRELERERFFKLPIIKKEITSRWNFSVPVDLSLRKKNHNIFNLEGELSSGGIVIKPEKLIRGILGNELVCRYINNDLYQEIIDNIDTEESGEFLVFLKDEISPILPPISIKLPKKEDDSSSKDDKFLRLKSISKKLILGPDNNFLLYYSFEPFYCCPGNFQLELDAMELQPGDFPEIALVPGEEVIVEIQIITEEKETLIPVEVSICRKELSSVTSIVYGEVTYSFPLDEEISNLIIMGSICREKSDLKCLPVRYKKVINEKKITIHVFYDLPVDDSFEKLLWNIRSYYYELKKPIIINTNAIEDKTQWKPTTSLLEGKVVISGNPPEME